MPRLSQMDRQYRKRTLTFSLLLLLMASVLSAKSFAVAQAYSSDINYSIKSTVTFINPNEGTRTWNLTEEDRTVSLFMNTSWQSVELKTANYPLESPKKDTDGNSIVALNFDKQQLLPGQNVTYTTEHLVLSRPRAMPNILESESGTLNDIPQDFREDFTRAEGAMLVNDPDLVQLAHNLAGDEKRVLNIVKGFVAWITSNIDYKIHEFPFYPNETLRQLEGDCDDQAVLFITLARIVGIPAYLQLGAIYMPTPPEQFIEEKLWDNHLSVVQKSIGWHGWAIVYVPPWGWLPVDLTYVLSDSLDPLSAIRYGAVTVQSTVQYMNVSAIDYVAESREAMNFLLTNGFYVNTTDEMTRIAPSSLFGSPEASIAVVMGVATFVLVVSCLLIVRRQRRHSEKVEASVSPACLTLLPFEQLSDCLLPSLSFSSCATCCDQAYLLAWWRMS